jgi:two-component system CheB/CheR fusion protein
LPFHLGAAFVVILHINPETESQLATVLALHTAMPVVAVTGSMPLMADRVYVIPPDRQLEISDNEIAAVSFEEPRGHRAPIDTFFRSLATQKGDGFAVILSGGGSDGAVGIKAVKEAGGIILVQDPAEAEFSSMPSAAIATEGVDFVLPIRDVQTSNRTIMLTDGSALMVALPACGMRLKTRRSAACSTVM